jgi:DNA-directed RNA polymerase subunit omega
VTLVACAPLAALASMQYTGSATPGIFRKFIVMARVTVEDCLQNVDNLFQLVLLASQRARRLANGAEPTVPIENDKATVLALREIAAGNITPEMLREPEPRADTLVPDADNEATFRAPQFGLIDREL